MPVKAKTKMKPRTRLGWFVSEPLESRQFLSASLAPVAAPTADPIGPGSATQFGFNASQISVAYGIDAIRFGNVVGNGEGQTIAIVAAYDNPKFVDSTDAGFTNSDLHKFDVAMGLPDPPSFKKVSQIGGTSFPTTNSSWANEVALDVEWAHAIAPRANILLVEADSAGLDDLLGTAVPYAASVAAVSVINMSFAVGEFGSQSTYDANLRTPAGHQGITFLAATGDNGRGSSYPSSSSGVVAVGSTDLTLSGSNYGGETAFNGSGGGISAYVHKPGYQSAVTQSDTLRTTPDVSIDGNPNTGVSVYDSFNGGDSNPWYKLGGSSAAVVFWSGLISIADQGRVIDGSGTLNGATQTLPSLYAAPTSDFHDITSGSNGYDAVAGYDLVTGIGSPVANRLIPNLAASTVTAAATKLAFATQPSTIVAGHAISPAITVDLEESNGSIFTLSDSAVTLSIADGSQTLGGAVTVDSINGVATFSNITVPAAGTYQLVATGGSLTSATSISFTVTPAPLVASKLSFAQQPSTATAGSFIATPIVVQVVNTTGDVVTTDHSAVTLTFGDTTPGATLTGTLTANAVNGVATFDRVIVTAPGTFTLIAADGLLTTAVSSSFVVTPKPAKLAFLTQPASVTAGTALTPSITVQVQDAFGALIPSDTSAVTLSVANGPAGATIGGTVTVNAVGGVATFSAVTLSAAGSYTLTATDGSLTAATSAAVTIVPPGTVQPVVTSATLPTAVVSGAKVRGQVVVTETSTDVPTAGVVVTNVYAVAVDGTTTLLGTVSRKLKLAAGQSARITVPITQIPASLDGTYTLRAVVVDPAGHTDGTAAATALTAAAPFIAVTPAVTKLVLPSTVVAGVKIKAAAVVKVTNAGNVVSSGTTIVGIYASADGTLGNATLIASLVKRLSIKPGGSAVVSVPIRSVPASINGTYQILAAVTDPKAVVATANSGSSVLVSPPTISFTATPPTVAPLSITAGKSGVLTLTVTNTGNVPAAGLATIAIGLSAVTTAQQTPAVTLTRPLKLAAGKSAVLRLKFTVPAGTAAGDYFPTVTFTQVGQSVQTIGTIAFTIT